MTASLDPQPMSNNAEASVLSLEQPLGLQNPLLPAFTLGQSFLSPKFLSPLGAKPLGGTNPLSSAAQEPQTYSLPTASFDDSLLLGNSDSSLASEPIAVQRLPLATETLSTESVVQAFSEPDFSPSSPSVDVVSQVTESSAPTEAIAPTSTTPQVIQPSPIPASESIVQAFTEPDYISSSPSTDVASQVTESSTPTQAIAPSSTTPQIVQPSPAPSRESIVQAFAEPDYTPSSPSVDVVSQVTESSASDEAIAPASTSQVVQPSPTPASESIVQAFTEPDYTSSSPSADLVSQVTESSAPTEAIAPPITTPQVVPATPAPSTENIVQAFSEPDYTPSSVSADVVSQVTESPDPTEAIAPTSTTPQVVQPSPTPSAESIVQAFTEPDYTPSSPSVDVVSQVTESSAPTEAIAPSSTTPQVVPATPAPSTENIVQAFSEPDYTPSSVSADVVSQVTESSAPTEVIAPSSTTPQVRQPSPTPSAESIVQAFTEPDYTSSNSSPDVMSQVTESSASDEAVAPSSMPQVVPATPTPSGESLVQAFAEPDYTSSSPSLDVVSQVTESSAPTEVIAPSSTTSQVVQPSPTPVSESIVQAFAEPDYTPSSPSVDVVSQVTESSAPTEAIAPSSRTPQVVPTTPAPSTENIVQAFTEPDYTSSNSAADVVSEITESSAASEAIAPTSTTPQDLQPSPIPSRENIIQAFAESDFTPSNPSADVVSQVTESSTPTEAIAPSPTIPQVVPTTPAPSTENLVQAFAEPDYTSSSPSVDVVSEITESSAASEALASSSTTPQVVQPSPTPSTENLVQAFAEADLNQPSTSNISDSAATVVQTFSATETLPQLPTVLQNLASTKSIGSSKPLAQQSNFLTTGSLAEPSAGLANRIQRTPAAFSETQEEQLNTSLPTVQASPISRDTVLATGNKLTESVGDRRPSTTPSPPSAFAPNINRSSTAGFNQPTQALETPAPATIPDSWSSIADLLDNSSATASESVVVQPLGDNRQWGDELSHLSSTNSGFSQSASTEEFPATAASSTVIQPYSQPSISPSTFSETPIQRFIDPSKEPDTASEVVSSGDNSAKEGDSQSEDAKNFELLAREMYNLLRQRLEIERERQGQYYSDRLPW